MVEPVWAHRNLMLQRFDFTEKSVVDFGCGDKSVLNYIKVKEYLGIDKTDKADVKIDFDKDAIELSKIYDVGLVLGVLEYLDDPENFLKKVKPLASRFYIMMLVNKRKKTWHGWKQAFTSTSGSEMLDRVFKTKNLIEENGYILAECY